MNSISGVPVLDSYYNNLTFNPILILVVIVVIVLYIILFGSLGEGGVVDEYSNESNSTSFKLLGIIIASLFIVLIVVNGFNYFIGVDIVASIKNFFSRTPEIDIQVNDHTKISGSDEVPEIKFTKQVYHIPGNKYTYSDAKALCKAYGNRLANYKELENAYNDGANWCSYGWSDDQMALYPTQYEKWEKLQKVRGHENDCGRPGINGGYIDNPNVRFGVNCYGFKPKITAQEAELMENAPEFPLTQKEVELEKRVKHWKSRISDILIAPFNSKNWSKI